MSNNAEAPLSGLRVLDLSTMLAGPFGSMMLGDLGAEVIKVETLTGDNTRNFPPHYHKGESLYYMSFNRNKKSIALNLKSEKGLELFYELVKESDIVWDNYRDGVTDRLKIDYDTLSKINPRIICCSITAYGHQNPYDRHEPSYDLCIQAMSGVLSMTGERDRPPVKLGVPMADIAGGWYGVVGVLAAVAAREKTGKGQKVDIAMLDALASLHCYEGTYYLNSGVVPERLGTRHRSLVPYQIFRTKDIYIAVVVASDKFWNKLCDAMGNEKLADDERFSDLKSRYDNREALAQLLEEIFMEQDSDYWLERLRHEGVPCAPVNTIDKAMDENLLKHREMIVELDHKGESVRLLGNPIKMSGNLPQRYTCPPALGENTSELLRDLLGKDEDEIQSLADGNVILK